MENNIAENIENTENVSEVKLNKKDLKNFSLNFSDNYIKNNYPEHIPTGFSELDKLLGGGLAPGLIVLGAISSLGKSTFSLQVAQNIAKQGRPVIYYSLEMSKHAVSMKAVQRSAFIKCRKKAKSLFKTDENGARYISPSVYEKLKKESVSTYDLLRNVPEKEELKKSAMEECANECKDNLFIIERDFSNSDFSAKSISDFVTEFIRVTGTKPVVFVDYLQILISSTDKSRKTEKQIVDENIQKLWLIANQNQIPVFVISSVNRDSYSKSISFSSFKESGGIEFTADIVLGMQFSALHGRRNEDRQAFNPDEEKGKDPRRVEVIVLKQRYGKSGSNAYDRFIYFPEFSYFEEGDTEGLASEPTTEEKEEKKSVRKSRLSTGSGKRV
ncbi:MAG: hypothetical protein J6B08_05255 [Ruminiclostridium sp.]|nr:hypothetical protein [Ruminiclostridium sp.]